jgi:hypothetical protein
VTAFGLSAPFVRGAYAAGKLSVGFWDHWVPNANGATQALVKEWSDKEKVEVQLDFITTQANKLLLTGAAESQAKTGHDILAHTSFLPARYAEQLVPVNDLMDQLVKTNGPVNGTVEYLGKVGGGRGVPQGRQAVRHRRRQHRRQQRHDRRDLPCLWRRAGERER